MGRPVAGDDPLVDFVGSERHFVDHLTPIRDALPAEHRGALLHRNELRRSRRLTVVASAGDLNIALRAYRPVVLAEHGAGQSYSNRSASYVGGGGRERVRAFFVPNLQAARRNARYYPATPNVLIGCTKLAELERRRPDPDPITAAISFHWRCSVSPEASSAVDHYRAALEPLRVELEARGIRLLGHAHPRLAGEAAGMYERAGIEFVAEFSDVVARAHLYAVDNSSTLFEFAALGRPVVVLNCPAYRRDVEHGLRFWQEASVGLNVSEPGRLLGGILEALEDGPELARSRAASIARVYPVTDGATIAATALLGMIGPACVVCRDPRHACGGPTAVLPVDDLKDHKTMRSGPLKRYPNPARPGAFLKLRESTARRMGLEPGPQRPREASAPVPAPTTADEEPETAEDPATAEPEADSPLRAGALRPGGPTHRARAAALEPEDKKRPAPTARRRRRVEG